MSSEARPPGDAAVVVDQVADRAGEATAYHAFISYSRQDSLAASGIQKALHRIGRRAGRLHALRVFRDSTDLVANPDLWGRVKDALDDSAYLIVLLSPSAAASRWVNKEVLHWIQQRGLERLLLVLVDGELHWDSAVGCFDPAKSSAALPALTVAGSVPTEPIYVDISRDSPWDPNAATFRDKVIDLAAPIHGKSKYELASDDVREQRRYRRLRGVAVAGLAVLTVVAVAAAGIAFAKQREAVHHRQLADQQREEAIHQRNEAEVRRLLGDADTVLAGNRSGGDFRAFQELLAAHALSPDTAAGGLLDAAIRRSTTKKIIPLPGEQLSAVAISPKGDRIVSAAYEGAVRLLDAHSGRTIATVSENAPDTDDLDSHMDSVVFSPDGRWFAARRYDGAIRLWDSESHVLIMTIQADDLDGDIAVSADGRRLASLSGSDKLQMWDTTTGGLVDEYTATQNQSMTSVALSRDGRTVGAGTLNGVMLWDIGGNPIGFRPTPEIVNDVAFSPDGSRFVAAETTGDVSAWDARTGNPRGMLTKVGTNVDAVAFTPDGRRLATGSDDGVVRFWDPESGKPLGELRGHTDGVRGISFDSDGARMASAGSDGEVRLWDTGTAGEFPVLDADSKEVQVVAYSRDGKLLATGGNDNIARVWDPTTGALVKTIKAGSEGQPIVGLALSPDGHQLATVGDFNSVRLWDVNSGKLFRDLGGHHNQTLAVAYSSDGHKLVSGDIDGRILVWDPATGAPLMKVTDSGMPVTSVVFSPDGKMVASAGEDSMVQLWDLEQKKQDEPLLAYGGAMLGLAFSADGRLVAGAGADETVRVWDVNSGTLVQTLTGHNGSVLGVAFSPTAHAILASTGEDNAVRLWNVNTGQPVGAPLAGHTGQVRGVAFSPDGTRVASGGADGKVRFWLAGATPEMFCDKIIYNMNEDQWRQWVSPDVEYRSDVCEGLPAFPG